MFVPGAATSTDVRPWFEKYARPPVEVLAATEITLGRSKPAGYERQKEESLLTPLFPAAVTKA